jgi:RNA polymerase sigma factor (sigma-70 family)
MPRCDLMPHERDAVEFAVRATWRFGGGDTVDDRRQDAAEAVLRAQVDASRDETERAGYLAIRARGGVIDALRAARRAAWMRVRGGDEAVPERYTANDDAQEDPVDHLVGDDDPEARVVVLQAAEAIDRMPAPRPLVARRIIEGAQTQEIAAELGLSPSRISQLRREIAANLWEHLECDSCPA